MDLIGPKLHPVLEDETYLHETRLLDVSETGERRLRHLICFTAVVSRHSAVFTCAKSLQSDAKIIWPLTDAKVSQCTESCNATA